MDSCFTPAAQTSLFADIYSRVSPRSQVQQGWVRDPQPHYPRDVNGFRARYLFILALRAASTSRVRSRRLY
jgi:hypothetical protein